MKYVSIPEFFTEFQPVYSLVHRRMVGVEAFLRFKDQQLSTVAWLQEQRMHSSEHMYVCDLQLSESHLEAFKNLGRRDIWLFLNIDLISLESPHFVQDLKSLVDRMEVPCSGIVLEFSKNSAPQASFEQIIPQFKMLRDYGFLITIDNFGLHHSRLDRVFEITPHFIKLDGDKVQYDQPRILHRLVHLIHEMGAIVNLANIETKDHIEAALENGCDLVQGYWLAHPSINPLDQEQEISQKIDHIWSERQHRQMLERKIQRRQRELAQQAFMESALSLTQHAPFEQAAQPMLALPHVIRCFVLNDQGFQSGHLMVNQQGHAKPHPGFLPLQYTEDANWSRREYFQNALEQPGILHLSPVYLSINDACRCATLSMGIEIHEKLHVLCADLFLGPVHSVL
jgi:EAL domain-containing protein (putative c-di-GMP-specific phosphodiesterase class I)